MRHAPQAADSINTHGWMMSYADMVTILLAMLIVLSTLSSDQTGLTLYNGAASFTRRSDRSVCLDSPSLPCGRLQQTIQLLIISSNRERKARTTAWTNRCNAFFWNCSGSSRLSVRGPRLGQVVIDLYEPLHRDAPYLAPRHLAALHRVRPLLERANYQLRLVVWTPTPRPSAWSRSATQARLAADEFASAARLSPAAAERLVPLAQPWRYRDIRRPILSLVVVKVAE